MNKIIFIALTAVAFLASSLNSEAQGRVNFSNTLNNRITNSLTDQPISGTNAFCIGLYVGPNGSTAAQLTLVGLTTNAPSGVPTDPFAGLFNGGNPFKLPIPYDDSAPVAFQIRAWTLADGASYEAALLSGDPNLLIGQSALGWVIPTLPPSLPSSLPNLFGVGPGQVSAFSLV
ncbi:MAG: hypothetical protein JWR69_1946, partial [Pedosphaera sp.]|nr:hypothetical protein [Pedosphaera sp.]